MQQRSTGTILVAFVVGLALGLVYGWVISPVDWTIENPAQLAGAICQLAGDSSTSATDVATLENMARGYNGQGCGLGTVADSGVPVADQTGSDNSGSSPLVLILVILVLVVVFVILWRRRSALMGDTVEEPRYAEVPDAGPVLAGNNDIATVPIARFRTTYVLGHDTYDDSFSIENSLGDFLGECGVSVAESIGTDAPKNVTAFEVWLFDKNDIRTITKVVMSDHAFFDDALKAKLAPKGEPVLARENETVVLETATLIINAEITELAYGTGTLPPQSFFERITIELSAWSKEGDFEEPDLQSRADELMNF